MIRTPLIAGNWKMNLDPAGAESLASGVARAVSEARAEVWVCPSAPLLKAAGDRLQGSNVGLGAQDCFWAPSGAFTGQVSVAMLQGLGVGACIVGHSETRGRFGKLEVPTETMTYFNETNFTVNLKVRSLLDADIMPILCVGETLTERQAGKTDSVIRAQLAGALAGLASLGRLVVAYEPVWAIGTGQTCDPEEAQRVCATIRAWFVESRGTSDVRVLYGGSMKASNARALLAQPDIDGGLVGGASLDAAEFAAIVQAAE